jgi:hypothetical protein
MRLRFDLPFSLVGNVEIDNLRPGGALSWKTEDHQLERSV